MITMEENMRRVTVLFLVIWFVTCVSACRKEDSETMSLNPTEIQNEDAEVENTDNIFVYVCGAVQNEGVYELPAGSRVYEAIEKAGGFREDAAKAEINQAEVLEDAMRLYVPTMAEFVDSQSKKGSKININKASKEELMTLPGVGESKAESIIQYRKEQGTFKKTEDIMEISGIKEGLYEKIKDLITI